MSRKTSCFSLSSQSLYEEQVALNEAALVQAQAEYDRQQALSKQNATAASSLEKQLSSARSGQGAG